MAASTVLGLDIGATSIRAVETSRGKGGPAVSRHGEVTLPADSVSAGVIQDPKAVTHAIRELRSDARFRTKAVVLGVTNPQIVVREMSVTNLPAKDLRASLPFQVRDVLPLPVERSVLDFLPLEDPGRNEMVRGLLIAAPKEAVQNAVQTVEKAGLKVIRVDLASLALLRASGHLDDRVEAIIDIGTSLTSVIVHSDGVPLIVRTIPRGGGELTAAVSARLGIPPAEAEVLKCEVGLWTEKGAEAADAIREALRPLLNEIRGSFAYLSNGGRQTRVDRLLLAGGGTMLPGLPELLASQFEVAVEDADPLTRFSADRRAATGPLPASAAVPVGLALGAIR